MEERSGRNYYGSLCTEMYELLHAEAPPDELAFYLSYAQTGQKILEPMCGSGRFLVPFAQRGLDIVGADSSEEMLGKLKAKLPSAAVTCADMIAFDPQETFDYVFITSGSVSLFTDLAACRKVLRRVRELLKPEGVFVFAVDTVACRCADDADFLPSATVSTQDGCDLVLKTKNRYDEQTRTQFSPGRYELYREGELLRREPMDFQTHLYEFGEMEGYLSEAGFRRVSVYSSFSKEPAIDSSPEMFLYECRLG